MTDVFRGPFPTVEDVKRGSVEERQHLERRAWARLLVARTLFWRGKEGQGPSAGDLADRCCAALAELKALGVDVEALEKEAGAAVGR